MPPVRDQQEGYWWNWVGNSSMGGRLWAVYSPLSFQKNQTLTWSTYPASTTSTTLNNSQHACSQYMHCSTFLTKLDRWGHAGQHGLSPLRGNVGTFNIASRVDKTHMWAWTNTLLICRSSGKSRSYTILLMSNLENPPRAPLRERKGLKIVSRVLVPSP